MCAGCPRKVSPAPRSRLLIRPYKAGQSAPPATTSLACRFRKYLNQSSTFHQRPSLISPTPVFQCSPQCCVMLCLSLPSSTAAFIFAAPLKLAAACPSTPPVASLRYFFSLFLFFCSLSSPYSGRHTNARGNEIHLALFSTLLYLSFIIFISLYIYCFIRIDIS